MASVTPAGHAAGHSQAGTVEAQQATPEQMAEIRRLAQVIARLFYEDGHILVMDSSLVSLRFPQKCSLAVLACRRVT